MRCKSIEVLRGGGQSLPFDGAGRRHYKVQQGVNDHATGILHIQEKIDGVEGHHKRKWPEEDEEVRMRHAWGGGRPVGCATVAAAAAGLGEPTGGRACWHLM